MVRSPSSRLESGCPHLHLRCSAVGPRVVRNERKLNLARLAGLGRITVVQVAARVRLLVNCAGMAQNHDSVKQVAVKFLVELRGGLLPQVQSYFSELHSRGLVELFEAIDERA